MLDIFKFFEPDFSFGIKITEDIAMGKKNKDDDIMECITELCCKQDIFIREFIDGELLILNIPQITIEAFQSKSRKREIVKRRQLAMYFCRRKTSLSLEQIGLKLASKDHATVLHAIKEIHNLVQTDFKFRESFNKLEARINFRMKKLQKKDPPEKNSLKSRLHEISAYTDIINMRIALNELRNEL